MITHMQIHPCFSCSLPDCDEESKSCALRRAIKIYRNLKNRGEPVSDEIKARGYLAHREIYGASHDERERERRAAARGARAK